MNEFMNKTARQAKRLIIGTIGFSVVLIGIAMIVLPGPAILVIPAGWEFSPRNLSGPGSC